ncbi:MAG TPA: hypothetical protein VH765_12355 [Xanthobacteraceae bacterium]|jgi:hypothetical protein
MQQILNQILQFLQQGIAAIFRFIQLVWNWSSAQITKLFGVPWESWPLWKQLVLAVIAAVVIYILFTAAMRLWASAVRVLAAFAGLLVVLVSTLPAILLAGLVALGGLWAVNNVNLSSITLPTIFSGQDSSQQVSRDADKPAEAR